MKIAAGVLGLLLVLEGRNRVLSRLIRAIKRGIFAAVASYIEERGGLKLFTLDDELPELPDRMPSLDLSQMDPRFLFPGSPTSSSTATASTAAAVAAAVATGNGDSQQSTPFSANYFPETSRDTSGHSDASTDSVEQLLSSAKLFAVMELEASRKLYDLCPVVKLAPYEKLFSAGELSDSGVYIVIEGKLGTYLDNTHHTYHQKEQQQPKSQAAGREEKEQHQGDENSKGRTSFESDSDLHHHHHHINKHLVHVSTLTFGNSIGDVDVLDGAPRSVTAQATETGCRLLQINRNLFLKTVIENPRVLQSYLVNSIARLWRVGHFTLRDFLQLPLESLPAQKMASGGGGGGGGGIIQNLNKNVAGTAGEHTDVYDITRLEESNGKTLSLTGEQEIILAEAVLLPPLPEAKNAGAAAAAAAGGSAAAVQEGKNKGNVQPRVRFSLDFDEPNSTGVDDSIKPAGVSSSEAVKLGAEVVKAQACSAGAPSYFSPYSSPSLPVMVHTHYASLEAGWDVLTPEESGLGAATLTLLAKTAAALLVESLISQPAFSKIPSPPPQLQQQHQHQSVAPQFSVGRAVSLPPGTVLMDLDEPVDEVFILLEGSLVIERPVPGKKRKEIALVAPKSLISGGSFLTATHSRAKAWAVGQGCVVVAVGQQHIDALIDQAETLKNSNITTNFVGEEESVDSDSMHTADEGTASRSTSQQSMQSMISACSTFSNGNTINSTNTENVSLSLHPGAVVTDLLLAAARALGPTIRQFISLGLVREWYHAGKVIYRAGQPAESLYIIISGRARLLHISPSPSLGSNNNTAGGAGAGGYGSASSAVDFRIEDDVGRGDSMGAVYTVSGGQHDTTCLCARDVEAVRMSKASFELLAATRPKAAARVLQGMAERLAAANSSRRVATGGGVGGGGVCGGAGKRGEIATIAILPAGTPRNTSYVSLREKSATNEANEEHHHHEDAQVSQLAEALRDHLESSFGPTSLLDFSAIQRMFPTESEHLDVPFFRSKVTTWLSQQEEDCRFIILQGGTSDWSGGCGSGSGGGASNINSNGNDINTSNSNAVWNRICADQADCILLVASPHTTNPDISPEEDFLVWKSMETAAHRLQRAFSTTVNGSTTYNEKKEAGRQKQQQNQVLLSAFASGAAQPLNPFEAAVEFGDAAFAEALQYNTGTGIGTAFSSPGCPTTTATASFNPPSLISLRRVELVLLHASNSNPHGTAQWLEARPHLTRHHHVRLSRPESVARLGRWMAGATVGVVLSGGGSRGLAHLGVLRALHDAGVPIDVVGGTSQGAMMAALYAQDVGWPAMQKTVRRYASEMGSARRLASDLTLPLLSVFTGAALDDVVRDAFASGPDRIEDLWLRFFCVTTNLTIGAPSIHQHGVLWRAVRASMTLIGLVPPVVDETGQLLCDGGYSDNMPVAAMREQIGTSGSVIVVDVEDRDQSAWHNLSRTDGGVSGWQLLWDRWCPIEKWRFGIRVPNHASLMNALTWMAHKQNLARLVREGQRVDLYLRPPVTRYRLMDYHLADRIATEANRYAFKAIAYWQRRQGGMGAVPFSAKQVIAAADLGASQAVSRVEPLQRSSTLLHPPTEHQLQEQQHVQRPLKPQGLLGSRRGSLALPSAVPSAAAAAVPLKRRSSSVQCMSQLQAKHADNEVDEDTSSSSTTEGLLAPLQMLTRAATAHPNLAANLAAFRLAPLAEDVSDEISSPLSEENREKQKEKEEKEAYSSSSSSDKSSSSKAAVNAAERAEAVDAQRGDYVSSAAAPPKSIADTTEKEDQFAYLDKIEIGFDEDDLPS